MAMSKVGFYLLLPAITFVKVAEAVDATILRAWWPLAANLVFSIGVGIAFGYALSRLLRVPRPLERTVVVAASIGNINTIPLLVVASLCQSDSLMFRQVLGSQCSTVGIAYVAVGMAVGSVFHHSLAFHMLKPPKGSAQDAAEDGGGGHTAHAHPSLTASCPTCGREGARAPTADGGALGTNPHSRRASSRGGGRLSADARSASLQSWQSDDMFSGLETFTEAAAYLHTPGHPAGWAHHFATPWGQVTGPWAVGWGSGRPGTPRPGSAGGGGLIHRRPRSTSAPEVGSPMRVARAGPLTAIASGDLDGKGGGGGAGLAQRRSSGGLGGGGGDEEMGHGGAGRPRREPRFPTIASVGDGLEGAVAAVEGALEDRAPSSGGGSLSHALAARHPSIISLEARSAMDEPDHAGGGPGVDLGEGSPEKGHSAERARASSSSGGARGGSGEAAAPAQPPAQPARCACCAHPALAPLARAASLTGRALLIVASPFLWVLVMLERLLPVPALISLAGIGVGCCPPLKALFFGPHAPLEFAAHALHTVAAATVPIMSFILGAVLYKGPGKGATIKWHVIAGVCLVRLLIIPLLGAVVVFATEAAGWWKPLDPLFVFTLLLQWIAPTAINMQAIATMFRYKEADMGALIFWQHALYLVTLPLYICGVMHWLDRLPMDWTASPHNLAPNSDPGLMP